MTLSPEVSGSPPYFRLFVAGLSPRSVRAIANVRHLLETQLAGHYELEIADVNQRPVWVHEANLVALPTLERVSPTPSVRVIGDLSTPDRALQTLFPGAGPPREAP